MRFIPPLVAAVLGLAHAPALAQPSSPNALPQPVPAGAPEPHAAFGAMVGEMTSSSAIIQTRLTLRADPTGRDVAGTWGIAEFTLRQVGQAEGPVRRKTAGGIPQRDFIARVKFDNLIPDTRYRCDIRMGRDRGTLRDGPTVSFRTLPGRSGDRTVRFVVVTGMNYAKFHGDRRIDREQHRLENQIDLPPGYDGPDRELGYPALSTIADLRPDFFVGTGDNVYYDTPDASRAIDVTSMRQKWHEQFLQPRFVRLFQRVPTLWMIDDHDFRVDDADNSGDYLPLPETGRALMLEQLPIAPFERSAASTFRTIRVHRDLQIWVTENRLHRSPNAMPDGPGKTIWGERQKRWLMRTMLASDAKFKVLISPTPMIGPDDLRKKDNHCDVGGFRHERDEFFRFVRDSAIDESRFFVVCGDRHWQYHAIDAEGMQEFSCGALVDANSRLPRRPGDPLGTDPDGTIEHRHTQDEPSGGFLLVTIGGRESGTTESHLSFDFRDEHGVRLYQTRF